MKRKDKTVEYLYENQWSLIHLLRRHASSPEDFEGLSDPKPHTLKFVVETEPEEITKQQDETSQSRVYIRLTPLTPDEKRKEPLIMPSYFPVQAPELEPHWTEGEEG
jgi:hypothetical protein